MLAKLFGKIRSLLFRPKKLDVYAQYTHNMGLSAKDVVDPSKPIYAHDLSEENPVSVKLTKEYLDNIWGAPKFHVEETNGSVQLNLPNVKVISKSSKEQETERNKSLTELRNRAINAWNSVGPDDPTFEDLKCSQRPPYPPLKKETEKKLVVRFAEPGEETEN